MATTRWWRVPSTTSDRITRTRGSSTHPRRSTSAGVGEHGNYSNCFLSHIHDFTGDGWPDVLMIMGFGPKPSFSAHLFVNPRGELRHWDNYNVVPSVTSETTQLFDIDGDGHPELILTQGDQVGYAKPDASDPTKPWRFFPVSEKAPRAPARHWRGGYQRRRPPGYHRRQRLVGAAARGNQRPMEISSGALRRHRRRAWPARGRRHSRLRRQRRRSSRCHYQPQCARPRIGMVRTTKKRARRGERGSAT